jgi:hypothetical protein
VRLQPQVAQRLGAFQAQQAAADDDAGARAGAAFEHRFQVFDGAVDEAVGRSRPGTGGTKGDEPVASTSLS